ncbi:MAG: hypothetical protein AAF581_00355 [Planctomycetota bacterium]
MNRITRLGLSTLVVVLSFSERSSAQDLFEITAPSLFQNGCIGPSPCDCPAIALGDVSGSFALQPIAPSLGPIFEFSVVNFVGQIDNGTTTTPISGSGMMTVDVIADVQNWTLNLDVGGVPRLFESLQNAPLLAPWYPGPIIFEVFSLDAGCDYDGLAITAVRAQPFDRGDCNVDGTFDISDPVYHLTWLFSSGPPLSCQDGCDANDDATLNIADAIVMLARLFGGGPLLPAPHNVCGADPSVDTLSCVASACP